MTKVLPVAGEGLNTESHSKAHCIWNFQSFGKQIDEFLDNNELNIYLYLSDSEESIDELDNRIFTSKCGFRILLLYICCFYRFPFACYNLILGFLCRHLGGDCFSERFSVE